MIRVLEEKDRTEVMDLLAPESTLNLFIMANVERNGFGSDFQELWGDFDVAGSRPRLRAVLLRYHRTFTPYAPGEFDVEGLAGILRGHQDRMATLGGIDRVMRRFEACPGLIADTSRRHTLFALDLRSEEGLAGVRVRPVPFRPERATPADVPAFLELWRGIAEFRDNAEESKRRDLEQGAARVYLFRDAGRVVTTVEIMAESSRSAMISGVATHPDYRHRGLATWLLVHVCRELLAEAKRPYLFYDNPEAGEIYRRVGFTDAGTWVMYATELSAQGGSERSVDHAAR